LPQSDRRHRRRIGTQDARTKAEGGYPGHRAQSLCFGLGKSALRSDQDGRSSSLRSNPRRLPGCRLIAPEKPPLSGPVRQQPVKMLQVGHFRHIGRAALLGCFHRMRLQPVLPDALGIGMPRLHRQNAPHPQFHCLFDDEIGARLLDRREQEPQVRWQHQYPRFRLADRHRAALSSLGQRRAPLAILPVEQQQRRIDGQSHHTRNIVRLIGGKPHRLPLRQGLIYKEPDLRIRHERDPMAQPPRTPEAAPLEDAPVAGTVADAPRDNWVDMLAPAPARPYLRLSRADRPIGTWLLLIPCLWAITLAAGSTGFRTWDLWLAVSCAVGAFLMRGAGCTWNDITDREIDAQVARTRSRPLPAGQVTVRQALVWMVAQAVVAAGILFTYNNLAILLGIASLALVAIYPFAKRFTWWPQVFLGLAFNWGALLAWAAHSGSVPPGAVFLYAAGIAWTLYYDTIYAHQDREDDALIGVKSTARLFADNSRSWLWAFFVLTILLFGAAIVSALAPSGRPLPLILGLIGVWAMGWHMVWQMQRLDLDDPASCLAAFRANRNAGLIPVLFLATAAWL
jgi:4-hydroxybenzoate polyprenyltransferase